MNKSDLIPHPLYRYLRIFAFDPSVASQLELANIAEITIPIAWEEKLEPGPVGEYIEVVDVDPASDAFYKPVDLNEPRLLAQNGLAPSERNPQFHQQMVYAVAMTTINHFEQALGRVALWSSHRPKNQEVEFVRRLRIYPHALRDRNAFYSPTKKALLFGYFPVDVLDTKNTPGTMVFTCLSHDITEAADINEIELRALYQLTTNHFQSVLRVTDDKDSMAEESFPLSEIRYNRLRRAVFCSMMVLQADSRILEQTLKQLVKREVWVNEYASKLKGEFQAIRQARLTWLEKQAKPSLLKARARVHADDPLGVEQNIGPSVVVEVEIPSTVWRAPGESSRQPTETIFDLTTIETEITLIRNAISTSVE